MLGLDRIDDGSIDDAVKALLWLAFVGTIAFMLAYVPLRLGYLEAKARVFGYACFLDVRMGPDATYAPTCVYVVDSGYNVYDTRMLANDTQKQ
jgi:hypothetical protein